MLFEGSSVRGEHLCGGFYFPVGGGGQGLAWLWCCLKVTWVQRHCWKNTRGGGVCGKSGTKHHLMLRWWWSVTSSPRNAPEWEQGTWPHRCLAVQCRLLNVGFVCEALKGLGLVPGIFLVPVKDIGVLLMGYTRNN